MWLPSVAEATPSGDDAPLPRARRYRPATGAPTPAAATPMDQAAVAARFRAAVAASLIRHRCAGARPGGRPVCRLIHVAPAAAPQAHGFGRHARISAVALAHPLQVLAVGHSATGSGFGPCRIPARSRSSRGPDIAMLPLSNQAEICRSARTRAAGTWPGGGVPGDGGDHASDSASNQDGLWPAF